MAQMSDAEWSDMNVTDNDAATIDDNTDVESHNSHTQTATDWEMLSESGTNASHLTNPLNHIITDDSENDQSNNVGTASQEPSDLMPQISEDNELPILPNNSNNNNENNEEKSLNNVNNRNNRNNSGLIPSYIDIEAELEHQRQIVDNLRQRLNQAESDNNVLEEKNRDQELEIGRLNNLAVRLGQQNDQLREIGRMNKKNNKRVKAIESKIKSKQIKQSKYGNIVKKKGGKYHRTSIPHRSKFKQQRTTTRKVMSSSRHW